MSADVPVTAIVVAAGESRRFGEDKLFCRLASRPVLAWSLDTLEACPFVASIVVVAGTGNLSRVQRLVSRKAYHKVSSVCQGGARRQDSVQNGLQAAAGAEWVAVHDAARPFLTVSLLERGLALAQDVGGAVAAVPVKDTIKLVEIEPFIERTPPRARLWLAQTPQIFRYESLVEAYARLGDANVTDDAEVLERAGFPSAVFTGSYENLKITTPEDLVIARSIARRRRGS